MTEARNTIRSWALVAVAVTSTALIGFGSWLIWLIGVSDWCGRAITGARGAARPDTAVGECFVLLDKQVAALAINSFIVLGTIALCLAVLVVIVLAGGRVSFKASKDGVEADVGKDAAVQSVADAAQDQANQVKSE